jgi:hypothetical protein
VPARCRCPTAQHRRAGSLGGRPLGTSRTDASIASLPLASAAERKCRCADGTVKSTDASGDLGRRFNMRFAAKRSAAARRTKGHGSLPATGGTNNGRRRILSNSSADCSFMSVSTTDSRSTRSFAESSRDGRFGFRNRRPPNQALQADEARDVQLGTSAHRGAPSFLFVLTISAGLLR